MLKVGRYQPQKIQSSDLKKVANEQLDYWLGKFVLEILEEERTWKRVSDDEIFQRLKIFLE